MFDNIRFTDNHGQFQQGMREALDRALEAIGITAEGYAKQKCPVDTGRLRNSITHSTKKNPAHHTFSWSDNSGSGTDITDSQGGEEDDSVYIGTNVSYAPYVEMGTSRMAARPFLKPAALDHTDEYKRIAMQNMQGS